MTLRANKWKIFIENQFDSVKQNTDRHSAMSAQCVALSLALTLQIPELNVSFQVTISPDFLRCTQRYELMALFRALNQIMKMHFLLQSLT